VIIEVSYSQKRKDLSKLASDYILESEASVQLVIGLDLEYGSSSKEAALFMWRPRWVTSERDGNEELVAEEVLQEVRKYFLLVVL